jgi:UDP-N-acetylmuramate--alanine ligase
MRFDLVRPNQPALPLQVNLPGHHNVLNALAAICVALELGVSDQAIASGLAQFKGVGRRLQVWGQPTWHGGQVTLIDDYGHHPVEIRATLEAVRGAYPDRRLVLVFQPHRYSRTRDLFDDFVRVLGSADALVLTEVYAAGEQPLAAADGRTLTRAVRQLGRLDPVFVPDLAELPETLTALARPGDVILLMGAGSIGSMPARLMEVQS